MSQKLMQECLDNVQIKKYVCHYANKVRRLFPRLMDTEDASDELWLAVFRAISLRYTPTPDVSLFLFAKRVVFSMYGNMVKWKGNAARYTNEWVYPRDTEYYAPYSFDSVYNEIDAAFTLDQIEKDLKDRTETSARYHLAVDIFQLLRKGSTVRQCCRVLEISDRQGYRIYEEIVWGYDLYRNKYWNDTITRDWRDYDENTTTGYRCPHEKFGTESAQYW